MTPTIEIARDTKNRILDAAEVLFATQGFFATSLRQITKQAGVNLAAVNYHFQSKELLFEAVLHRKIEPINVRRIAMLDALESGLPDEVPSLESVLKVLLMPVLEASLVGIELGHFPVLIGRLFTTPGEWAHQVLIRTFGSVLGRITTAIQRSVPHLRQEDLAWGLHFTAGAMSYHLAGGVIASLVGRDTVDPADHSEAVDRMVSYAAAGIRAMAQKAAHA